MGKLFDRVSVLNFIDEKRRGFEILKNGRNLAVLVHPHLGNGDFRRLGRSVENVVMRGVLLGIEQTRGNVSSQMIASTGGYMASTEDFLVLNISSGKWQQLCPET